MRKCKILHVHCKMYPSKSSLSEKHCFSAKFETIWHHSTQKTVKRFSEEILLKYQTIFSLNH